MTLLKNLSRFCLSSSLHMLHVEQPVLNCMMFCQTDSASTNANHRRPTVLAQCKWHLPVRTKYQVSVHKPGSHDQTDQLQQSTNNWQLVNAVNKARQSPYTNKGCRCNGNHCRLLISLVPLDLQLGGHINRSYMVTLNKKDDLVRACMCANSSYTCRASQ